MFKSDGYRHHLLWSECFCPSCVENLTCRVMALVGRAFGRRLGMEKAMAPHSSTLAWKIPWMEEPGRLQSMGSLRVRHDWTTSLSLFTCMHWRRKWQPTPVFLPGESQARGRMVAAVCGITQSRTRLKRLSSKEKVDQYNPLLCG